jgi:hypothetical protein
MQLNGLPRRSSLSAFTPRNDMENETAKHRQSGAKKRRKGDASGLKPST